ncbi:hypothetical protein BKA62DRAFT_318881 [Auriculariales sp. MPI-PUGE-AT-0066]|nr:hypothetical protein BKA62DRAFT_318881 [Auriculariales sp. MPI-PUGE-AT-0066]
MYAEPIAPRAQLEVGTAVDMLRNGVQLAQTTAFKWDFIDRPQEGSMYFIFLTDQTPGLPPDGIRYFGKDQMNTLSISQEVTLDIFDSSAGFIPGQDAVAHRKRKAYRLSRGGHQSCILIHYTRFPGHHQPVPPQLLQQPVRRYPLHNPGKPPMVPLPGPGQVGQQAVLARQQTAAVNAQTVAHEQRERQRSDLARRQMAMPEPEYDEQDDGAQQITPRALALARYKRNHDLMSEVFNNAAKLHQPPPPPASVPGFSQAELEATTAKLEKELEELEAKSAASKRARSLDVDVSMTVDEVPVA